MKFKDYVVDEPTKEMFDFFNKRTKDHIDRVKNNINIIVDKIHDISKKDLLMRGKKHDDSKYSNIEYIPYVWLTWWYKERNEGHNFRYPNDDIKNNVNKATQHHIIINKHHPESHSNINDMSDVDISEMVADWAAMSQELKKNDLEKWSKKMIKKWKFNNDQVKLINDLVNLLK